MRVTILGHASLLVESGDERILVDPVLRTTSLLDSVVHQYPRALRLGRMPRPTLLVITHSHYDHFDVETLEALPKDVPVVIPPDRNMQRRLASIGFTDLRVLDSWQGATHGSVRLLATPSDADVVEFGLVLETDVARFWHMSDAEPSPGTSEQLLAELGAIDVVAAKYQPPDPLLNVLHNLGSSFDRTSTARWLEHACGCRPKLAFPYASGLCLTRDHERLNRYAYPFSPEYVSAVLAERLRGVGTSAVVRPGDVISIDGAQVGVDTQASDFVRQCEEETSIEWEPIEADHLPRLRRPDEAQALRRELTEIAAGGEFAAWLQAHPKFLKPFREWRVLCQISVHLDGTERMHFQADLTGSSPEARLGKNPAANYFLHLGGDAAQRLLRGDASSVEVMYQGGARIFERIVSVRNGRVDAPDVKQVYGNFPDPFLCFANARAKLARAAAPPKRGAFECPLFVPVDQDAEAPAGNKATGCHACRSPRVLAGSQQANV